MDLKPLKVRELNQYIAKILSNDALLYNINVEGEVSNLKYHTNGHIYFSLKDEKSKVRCIMFVNNAENLEFKIEDGMKLIVSGAITLYERDGSYQINVKKAKLSGRGELYAQFEKLKEKLFLEGLFDESRKKDIPIYPKRIGLITSITGATVRDMIININRRNPKVDILIKPTLVQGQNSKDDIVRSIENLNSRDDIDIIILGRGGGSIEELWSFNEELVARAISKSKIPIISAVGHETDFTIADFVADKRASTPSVAAEMSVLPLEKIEENLYRNYRYIVDLETRILDKEKDRLGMLRRRLLRESPSRNLYQLEEQLGNNLKRLDSSIKKILVQKQNSLDVLASKLDSLSPLATLDRGYAFIKDENENLISSKASLDIGMHLEIHFKDGKAGVTVDKLEDKGGE